MFTESPLAYIYKVICFIVMNIDANSGHLKYDVDSVILTSFDRR